jgi:hypothetical protein
LPAGTISSRPTVGPNIRDWARNRRNPAVIEPPRPDAARDPIWPNTAREAGFGRLDGARALWLWSRRSRVRVPSLTLLLGAPYGRSGRLQQRVGARFGAKHGSCRRIRQPRECRWRCAEQVVDSVAVILAPLALEQLLIGPQRQSRVCVADLLLRVRGVAAGRQQQADVGPPERVRGCIRRFGERPAREATRWPRRPPSRAPADECCWPPAGCRWPRRRTGHARDQSLLVEPDAPPGPGGAPRSRS